MHEMKRALRGLLLALLLSGGAGLSAAAPLPEGLARQLDALGRAGGDPGARLARAALAIEAAGWRADSLVLQGRSLRALGARPHPARVDSLAGETAAAPWRADALIASPADFQREARDWLTLMDRGGHPFAQLWLRPADGDTLALTAILQPGPGGKLGPLRVLGGRRLGEDFLVDYLDLPRDVPMTRAAAERGRERLAASGWFDRVDRPELGWDPVRGQVGVLYRVVERPRPNRITALLGSGSGETSGALDLDFFSPFGRGRRWQLGGDWQGRQRSRVDLSLSEPRLLGRPVAMDLGFHRAKQDSTFLQLSVEADLRLLLPAGWEGIAGIGYERSLFGLATGDVASDATMSRRRHRFGLAWRGLGEGGGLDRRLRLVGDLLIKRSTLPGEEGRERQYAVEGEGRWTVRLAPLWKLRLKGVGDLVHSAEGGFNAAELYPLGGALSLRGYDEEFFRGDRVASTSAELALGEPLELSLFLDYGWGRWRRDGAPTASFRGWGAGLGLLAPGPRGQLSLALAMGESKRLADLRVHLALDTGF
ncbi:MAG: hypothetical protein H6693_01995 [Candidatus Latescibacteria bacterium]|nr:hypothetical protein [Candidatus Latescibacterota bacterium]